MTLGSGERRLRSALRAGCALALAIPAGAMAQAAPQNTDTTTDEAPDAAAIVVTASRAAPNGADAPTPTTVLGSGAIDARQVSNVAALLNEQPAFRATTSPSANAIRTQTPGASTADLRGLGAARTLVLVNGARVPPLAPASNGTGTTPSAPDLNTIPTLMVERVEVVTGGASAQWGSDAVAGVVNIILKNRFKGLELRAQGGVSTYGDAGNYRLAALGGVEFGEGGHIVAGVDYVKNNEVGDIYSRPWGANEYGRVANAAFATNGQPANIIASNVHAGSSPGGLITGPVGFSLRNYEFTSATTVAPFDGGGIRNASLQVGGQGKSLAQGVSLAPSVERFNPYLHAEYEFSDALTIMAEASYSQTTAHLTALPPRDSSVTILASNPFIPDVVRTAMGALPSFTISRLDYDIGLFKVNVTNKTPRLMAGASGKLGGGWSWDAHVTWAQNDYRQTVPNNRNLTKFRFATDAVRSGNDIVCRATVPGPSFNAAAAGCVPINLFGNGTPSAPAINYILGTSVATAKYEQVTAAANLRGTPFSTWAGPVSIALGAEYRREKEVVGADAVAAAGLYETSNAAPYSGRFNVKEGYVEAIVPLARDLPGLRSLDLNGAVRVAGYSTAGTQTTWKGGAVWEPFDGLRLRGTRSRDIRAPAIFETSSAGAVTNLSATVNGVTAALIPQNATIGNAALRPEKADTLTIGAVLNPRFAPRLTLSVDYYNINLKDAVTTVSGTVAGNLCSAGQTYFCSLFTFAGTTPTAYNARYLNAASLRTNGLDIAGNYRLPLDTIHDGWKGSLTLSFSGTYVFHYYSNLGNGSTTIDYVRDNSPAGLPRFRSNTSLTYQRGGFSLTGQVTTISAGNIDNTANLNAATSINTNRVPAYQYLNLQISQEVGERFRLFAGVNNVFNTALPALPSTTVFTLTNGIYYDTIGRAFTLGANVRF